MTMSDLFHTPRLVHASTVDRGRTRAGNHGEEGRDARTTRRAQGKRYVASHRIALKRVRISRRVLFHGWFYD